LSPEFTKLLKAHSMLPVPEEVRTKASFLVWKTYFRFSMMLSYKASNFGPRWLIMGFIMARITRSGTLVGPGNIMSCLSSFKLNPLRFKG